MAVSPPFPGERFCIARLDLPIDPTFDTRVAAAPGVSLQVCAAQGGDAATWQALAGAHLYHVASARDDLPAQWFAGAPLLARCANLLAVTTFGAGYDTVDVEACTAAGVCVVNQAGSNAIAVGEHTFGLMIGLSKRIGEIDRRLRRGERFTRQQTLGFDLNGRTLGLVGIGHTGTRVAQLGAAFGMKVLASDPLLEAEEIRRRGAQPVTLPELLRAADVVSLHCPLNHSTRGFIDATAFAAMKRGALFITTSRGGIHDEAALFDALVRGHLGGAGLDVWDVEPPAAQHALLGLDNVIATNHVAGVTHDSRREMAAMGARQALALAAGARPQRLVNPEVWPAYARRFERAFGRAVAA
ncbi:MAG: hydroxyacid dehydrogenase [Burkholderiaceae bacterium]